jgi:hypothetical protein
MRYRNLLAVVVFVTGLAAAGTALAQTMPQQKPEPASPSPTLASLAGRYEGSTVSPDGPETFVADLKVADGAISGVITTTRRVITVTGGTVAGDRYIMAINLEGTPGSITGGLKDGTFTGQWTIGENNGTFTMKKAAATSATAGPAAAGANSLNGDWDAVLDMGGNQMPFWLSLKLDGQKVTGQVGSAERGTTALEGTWANGTLDFAFTMADGMRISMSATFSDGKLAGTMKLGDGQTAGGWAAARRR